MNLGETKLTDEGLKELTALTGLEELDLSFTAVTGDGLMELSALKQLRRLDIIGCDRVTSERVSDLRKALPELKIRQHPLDPEK